MKFNHLHYVPCLRWKQGEYQAVLRLPDKTKDVFTPLIEIPEIGWDFEKAKKAKTLKEHLAPFAERVYKKWGETSCFVDIKLIDPINNSIEGIHPVEFIFDALRKEKCAAIPVVGFDFDNDKAYQAEVKKVLTKDGRGICFRIPIELAANKTFKSDLDSLLTVLKTKANDCDFILDLGAPNFVPLDSFAKVIQSIISKLPYLGSWRTFSLIGTSFPETMGGIKSGLEKLPRYEWQLYKKIINSLINVKLRLPAFGDYAIAHPKVLELDMRVVKPSATIRYTIEDSWYIVKGKNVRDHGYSQYQGLCRQLLESRNYCGATFSYGDEYIQNCADGSGKTGSLPMWRQVGTNHHIEKVTHDIANYYDSLNTP